MSDKRTASHQRPALAGARAEHGPGAGTARASGEAHGADGYGTLVRDLVRNSGIYAIAAMASPLISLVLAPLLTHRLSRTDYGALAVLTTIIALVAGVTQLGLGSAFFRAYNYEYESARDRSDVLSTVVVLLALVTIPATVVGMVLAPSLAEMLLGSASYGSAVSLAVLVILLQNLSVPGFAWLRAESRAVTYSCLSVLNVVTVLVLTIVLVGVLQYGLLGALMATATGYACVTAVTLPVAIRRAGLSLRRDIARSLLTFGLPLVVNVITIWVLQLSDRYLLAHFGSLTQTASYDVAYKLGGVLSPLVLSPFQLAWPAALYAIARRSDAGLIFRRVFRWYGSFLLFATFALSLAGVAILRKLFPPAYQSASGIIPIIGLSLMFFGLSQVVGVGISVRRMTWLGALYIGFSAAVNVGLNIVWIPQFGEMAAALSTLAAYFLLLACEYVVNQRVYPVPFEIGRFSIALLVGVIVFGGCAALLALRPGLWAWAAQVAGLMAYGTWLFLWAGGLPALRAYRLQALRAGGVGWVRTRANGRTRASGTHAKEQESIGSPAPARVCMHVLGTARTDARVLREARTLAQTGLAISIVDVERSSDVPRTEDLGGITARHVVMPHWFRPTRFKPWFLIKAAQMFIRGTLALCRTPADLYHAHDYDALPACYVAARLRRKPLIFDAHELPLVDPHVTRWRLLCAMYGRLLGLIVPRCAGVITVSPPLACELEQRYGGPKPVLVRNIPHYQDSPRTERLRGRLDLGPDVRIALYQGNLQADRGLDTLARAARFLEPTIVIVMMGRGPLQPALERLIAHEGVGEAVKLLPPVAYDELLNWTASADVGLIVNPANFSRNVEVCLPNKLFEYLMAGVPVLSSRLPAVETIVAGYDVGWIVAPLEPETLGRAISAMLADRDGLERMRRSTVAATQQELNWEVEQWHLIGLYHRILTTRQPGIPGERTAAPVQRDAGGR